MTGYTVHTGSNQKFTAGWDNIFQGVGSAKKSASSGGSSKQKLASPPMAETKKGVAKKVGTQKTKRIK